MGSPNENILYRKWLLRRVGFRRKGYESLMYQLLKMTFYWSDKFPRDEDRALDGLMLREEYFEDVCPFGIAVECSVLEMLVGLAIRIDNEWTGDPVDPRPDIIFWEMIQNLGLDGQNNYRFNKDFIKDRVIVWLKRQYQPDGEQSIFPVEKSTKDHRNLTIWEQMLDYINQKYQK